AGVTVPAYASAHRTGADAESLAGILLALWAVGSTTGGLWFGTRRTSAHPTRQFAVLLGLVAASFAVFAVMPNPIALGVPLLLGGATT
ncbi:MFS transporter, partial [Micromonospora zhanjiangensis]